jgi:hypothetical protein
MGELFGVERRPHNRYSGAKILRQRWQAHIQNTLSRPVLLIDEAQEMQPGVLAELRLLASADLDAHVLLTTVLAGDGRLAERCARLRRSAARPAADRGLRLLCLPTSAVSRLSFGIAALLRACPASGLRPLGMVVRRYVTLFNGGAVVAITSATLRGRPRRFCGKITGAGGG